MEFDLNEEQRLLADSVARFVEGRYSPEQRRRWLAEPPGFSAGNWRAMVDLGLNALPFAEADGGLGGDRLTRSVLAEALGAGPATEPYLACIVMAGGLLAELGSRAQKDAWLAPLIDGSRVLCLAHAERASRDRVDRVRTSARRDGDGYRLDGEKTFVLAGGGADAAIVLARTAGEHDDRDGLSLFIVALDAPGLTRTPYRLVDGSLAAEIRFDAVHVADDALLGKAGGAWPAVRQTMVDTALAVCAESVGAMQRLLDMTLDYVRTREQFGGPIGRFQALQHRLVDAYLALEQARSLTMRVVRAADAAGGTDDAVAAAAFGARALVAEAARHVGHEAIQMHGGMGMTDELAVSHFHRRLLLLEAVFGDPSAHLDRYRDLVRARGIDSLCPPLALTPDLAAFRDEVRAFLGAELDDALREASANTPSVFVEKDVTIRWQQRLHARGWAGYQWPKEAGGTGWSPMQRYVFEKELAQAEAPRLAPMGLRFVAPVIFSFGTDAQKAFFLPRLLSGEHYWCQGYSEPGSGSDLASLKLRASRDDDHYVLNGSKIWTTHAHLADWIFCLVRTGGGDKPQQGITFLLVDMRAAGISVRPIPTLAGDHEVNQVFFDDVRVPVENRIGDEGDGWSVAKFLLEFERGGSCQAPAALVDLAELRTAASALPDGSGGVLLDEPRFGDALARLELEALAFETTELRILAELAKGRKPGPQTSLIKLVASALRQRIDALAVQAFGADARQLAHERPLYGPDRPAPIGCAQAQLAMPRYLNGRAWSIFGGTNEVQRNIIAKAVLRL